MWSDSYLRLFTKHIFHSQNFSLYCFVRLFYTHKNTNTDARHFTSRLWARFLIGTYITFALLNPSVWTISSVSISHLHTFTWPKSVLIHTHSAPIRLNFIAKSSRHLAAVSRLVDTSFLHLLACSNCCLEAATVMFDLLFCSLAFVR